MVCLSLIDKDAYDSEWDIINSLNERNDFYDFETCTGMDRNKQQLLYQAWIKGQKHFSRYGNDNKEEYYNNYFIVMDEPSKITGKAIIGYVYTVDKGNDWLWVSMILIDKDYQGKGYGKQTMKLLEEMAIKMGKKTINVDLDINIPEYKKKKNRLFKWYVSQGYSYLKVQDEQLFLEKKIEGVGEAFKRIATEMSGGIVDKITVNF
jgi:GNAT superfamily N-acetyltransferase